MTRRFRAAGKRWFPVVVAFLVSSLAACGGGGGGGGTPPPPPAAPSSLQANAAVGSSSVLILSWTDGSDNEDGFKIYRGATDNTVTTLVATIAVRGTESYSDTGLAASTKYHYKVTAYNSGGESAASNVANATTNAAPVAAPAAPSNLQAVAASSSAINLTWNDASSNEDGFRVWRGPDASNVTTLVVTLGAGSTSYSNIGLDASTTYHYKITAFNAGGESAASNVDNATTNAPPVTVPAAPSNLQATAASSSVINLTWNDASGNETGFRVFRGEGASPASFTQIGSDLGENVTAFVDTTATGSTTYVYRVRAFNSAGESSPAESPSVTTPAAPPQPVVPTSVEAGNRHSLALMSNGTVLAWGTNKHGALGVGPSIDNSLIPIPVVGLTGVKAISAGDGFSLVLMNDNTLKGWGENFFGAIGAGDNVAHYTPTDVWNLTDVTAVSAGGFFSVALKSDGTVWTWGSGLYGQLGDGTVDIPRYWPGQVVGLTGVTAISANQNHALVLKNDGRVWGWGLNDLGQIGDGTTDNCFLPTEVVGLTGVTAISAGTFHSLALLSDGTVRAWGDNSKGTLGDGTTTNRLTPVQVSGLDNVVAISAGGKFSVALKNDGTVWAWGDGTYGQIGDGGTTNRLVPVQVSGLTGVSTISAGIDHTLALRDAMTVWAWGFNQYGQIGDNSTTDRLSPVQSDGF